MISLGSLDKSGYKVLIVWHSFPAADRTVAVIAKSWMTLEDVKRFIIWDRHDIEFFK